MQIARWGNSLAVRLSADLLRELDLKEGDDIEFSALDAGRIAVITERQRRGALIAKMRELAVPFPADYKFDREEANAR